MVLVKITHDNQKDRNATESVGPLFLHSQIFGNYPKMAKKRLLCCTFESFFVNKTMIITVNIFLNTDCFGKLWKALKVGGFSKRFSIRRDEGVGPKFHGFGTMRKLHDTKNAQNSQKCWQTLHNATRIWRERETFQCNFTKGSCSFCFSVCSQNSAASEGRTEWCHRVQLSPLRSLRGRIQENLRHNSLKFRVTDASSSCFFFTVLSSGNQDQKEPPPLPDPGSAPSPFA